MSDIPFELPVNGSRAETLDSVLKKLSDKITKVWDAITEYIRSNLVSDTGKIEETEAALGMQISIATGFLSGKLDTVQSVLSSSINTINKNVSELLGDIESGFDIIESSIKTSILKSNDSLTAEIRAVGDKIDNVETQISINITEDIRNITDIISQLSEQLHLYIANFNDDVIRRFENIDSNITKSATNVINMLDMKIDTARRIIDDRLIESHNKLNSAIDITENNLTLKIESMQNTSREDTILLISSITALYDRFEAFLTEQFEPNEEQIRNVMLMQQNVTNSMLASYQPPNPGDL